MGQGKELTVHLEQYQQGGEALLRGRAGLELTEGGEEE